jgi:hypothetical protein
MHVDLIDCQHDLFAVILRSSKAAECAGSFSLMRLWRHKPVSEGLQKRHQLILLLTGQPEITDRGVHVLPYFRCRPARHLFSRGALQTAAELVARVVEMDDFFQALEVAIVHISFDEIRARPFVDVAQCRNLELAVELRSEPRPIRVRVEERISKEVADSSVNESGAGRVGCVSISVGLILVVIRDCRVPGDTKIA